MDVQSLKKQPEVTSHCFCAIGNYDEQSRAIQNGTQAQALQERKIDQVIKTSLANGNTKGQYLRTFTLIQ